MRVLQEKIDMKKGIFITATGTDVGKTYISGLLVKQIRENGIDCGYYKPVLSGALVENDKVIAGDAEHVTKTAGLGGNSLDRVSYLFKPAVSPHLAAEIEGRPIAIGKITEDFALAANKNEFTVVEGAGGIICPLNLEENLFIYDIPKALSLNILVVADGGLGTINNTFLTVDFIKRLGLNIKGIILNNFEPDNFMHKDNRKVIEQLCGVKVIGTVEKGAEQIEFIKNGLEAIYE